MASYLNKQIICGCCRKSYTARLVKGLFRGMAPDLDTNPHDPAMYDLIVMCPHCGYVSSHVREKVNDSVREAVRSKPYQDIFADSGTEDIWKKLELSCYLNKALGRKKDAGYGCLMAYWYAKSQGAHFREAAENKLEEAILCLSEYLEVHADVETGMVLVDCLRQSSRFAEAEETACSLMEYTKKPLYQKILQYERKLIAERDSLAHSEQEALS